MAKKKPKTRSVPMIDNITLQPGERVRLFCGSGSCLKEFEVTYEPKVGDGHPRDGIESATVMWCPFCGNDTIDPQ